MAWRDIIVPKMASLFTDFGSSDTTETWKRITEFYGVSLADIGSERFVNIFTAITQRRNVH
jgi:hypothetical protein